MARLAQLCASDLLRVTYQTHIFLETSLWDVSKSVGLITIRRDHEVRWFLRDELSYACSVQIIVRSASLIRVKVTSMYQTHIAGDRSKLYRLETVWYDEPRSNIGEVYHPYDTLRSLLTAQNLNLVTFFINLFWSSHINRTLLCNLLIMGFYNLYRSFQSDQISEIGSLSKLAI